MYLSVTGLLVIHHMTSNPGQDMFFISRRREGVAPATPVSDTPLRTGQLMFCCHTQTSRRSSVVDSLNVVFSGNVQVFFSAEQIMRIRGQKHEENCTKTRYGGFILMNISEHLSTTLTSKYQYFISFFVVLNRIFKGTSRQLTAEKFVQQLWFPVCDLLEH